ncbi:MAG TPA: IS110 family transposase [Candidatus Merdenecus merdavium]|nr:IS110 family transposase [Candidatus Merdenecus merdavium]
MVQPFKFTNDYDGFHLLIQKLDSLNSDSLIIGLESTAHYGNNLVKDNYKVCVINPIQTSTMRKNNIHKTKTDKVDTYIIAKTLMMNPHHFFSQHDLSIIHLKDLGRFRKKLIKKRTQGKIQLTSYVDHAFPELQCFFKSGIHQKSFYAVLKEAPTTVDITSMHLIHLAHLLEISDHSYLFF